MREFIKICLLLFLREVFGHVASGQCAALSIEGAVAMATEKSPVLQISLEGERTEAADLGVARGKNGISVAVKTAFSASDSNAAGHSNSDTDSVTASLPLYSGGINELNIASKKDNLQKSKLNTRQTEAGAKLNVIIAYYNALQAQKTVQVNQQSVDNYRAHLNNVKQLYAAGNNARIEVLRSEVALSDAEQSLIKAQNANEIAMSTLKNIIKLDSAEEFILTEDFKYQAFQETLPFCLDYAQLHRKDLQEDQLAVAIAEKGLKIAGHGCLPTVDLSVGASWDKRGLPSSNNHDYSAGVVINWNVFDNNVTKSQIEAAKAALEIATITANEDHDNVELAVRQSYLNMDEAGKRITSTGDAVKQAEETHYVASEKYKAGAGVMLDIIDSQRALSTAQLNYISAQYDFARGKATLENAMGISRES